MAVDLETKVKRALWAIRTANLAMDAAEGYRKTKSFVRDHNKISNVLTEVECVGKRVVRREVRPSDVHQLKNGVVKSVPYVYRAVARHIQRVQAEAE